MPYAGFLMKFRVAYRVLFAVLYVVLWLSDTMLTAVSGATRLH